MGITTDITGEAAPESPKPKKGKKSRRWLTMPKAVVISSVISAALGIVATLLVASNNTPTQLPAPVAVSEVLAVNRLATNSTNTISSQDYGAPVTGHLLAYDLPGGTQVFGAVRLKINANDTGNLSSYPVSFFQCTVNVDAKTFDCGQPWLGTPGKPGSYFIYVGLADQNTAGLIINALKDQARSNDEENWSHIAPPGFDALPGIAIDRR